MDYNFAASQTDLSACDTALAQLERFGTWDRATCRYCGGGVKADRHQGACPLLKLRELRAALAQALAAGLAPDRGFKLCAAACCYAHIAIADANAHAAEALALTTAQRDRYRADAGLEPGEGATAPEFFVASGDWALCRTCHQKALLAGTAPVTLERLHRLLHDGEKIKAIALLMRETATGLAESKRVVEALGY